MTPDWIKGWVKTIACSAFRETATFADIEAAMLSVASRVERETIERCKDAATSELKSWKSEGLLAEALGCGEARKAIAALPLQYKET